MSHEGIKAFDHRSPEEKKRDQEAQFREEAQRQLSEKGEIGLWGTNEEFWKREGKINSLACELEERAELKRLTEKYGKA